VAPLETIVVKRLSVHFRRVVHPFMGRVACPIREPCWPIPAETGDSASARIHWHVANLQGENDKEGRRSDRRHSANSFGERFES